MAQVLLGFAAQHHWLRFAYGRLGHLFPYLPHQPGYHKRLTAATPLILRPDRRDETRRHGNLAPIRQRIESITNTAKSQLSLERHGGRTPAGVMARVAQRILALAAAIWHNWAADAPVKRSLIAYDH